MMWFIIGALVGAAFAVAIIGFLAVADDEHDDAHRRRR